MHPSPSSDTSSPWLPSFRFCINPLLVMAWLGGCRSTYLMMMAFTNSHRRAMPRRALLVVDVQNDFLPGGLLPVPDGHEILAPLRTLMGSGAFELIVATQ